MICFTYVELDESIVALQQVNETVVRLVVLTDRLQMELDDIANQTRALNTSCAMQATGNPGIMAACSMINVTDYMVVIDYTNVSVSCVCVHACVLVYMCVHTCMGMCVTPQITHRTVF